LKELAPTLTQGPLLEEDFRFVEWLNVPKNRNLLDAKLSQLQKTTGARQAKSLAETNPDGIVSGIADLISALDDTQKLKLKNLLGLNE